MKTVDSYKFTRGITKRMIMSWIKQEQPREIPWSPLEKPLSRCKVAMISSGAIALKSDEPFDLQGERDNPWWGDPTFRIIPKTTRTADVRICHRHIDSSFAETDLNCILPIDRLAELVESGQIGEMAESHYSYMGYQIDPTELLQKSVPAIIQHLKNEGVDVVLLVPV